MKEFISIKGAKQHNLKNVDIDIPKNKLVVVTGPSGSGKSSLAFDTLYSEGQRKYMESLSNYAKHFIVNKGKPNVESITGLSPAISIDQKTTSKNSRSTVATITEIYDYLRVLFTRIGIPFSPVTGLEITKGTPSFIIRSIMNLPEDSKVRICAPVVINEKGNHATKLHELREKGFSKLKINGKAASLEDEIPSLSSSTRHTVEIIIDRVIVRETNRGRIVDSVDFALKQSDGLLHLDIVALGDSKEEHEMLGGQIVKNKESVAFSEKLYCPEANMTVPNIVTKIFSFNNHEGACLFCTGTGKEYNFKLDLIIDPDITLKDGAIKPWFFLNKRYYLQTLFSLSKYYKFSLDIPYSELPQKIKDILINGSGDEEVEFSFEENYGTSVVKRKFNGVLADLKERMASVSDLDQVDYLEEYQDYVNCSACNGYRLRPEILAIKINEKHIGEVCQMSISEGINWFSDLHNFLSENHKKISDLAVKEILKRMNFLVNVGLDYLTLSRGSSTLSGGESQRIRLASQIGSGLSGVIYVLDEPSIGLHQSDNMKLIETLKNLRDLGNSVIVVEHDEETMKHADYLIDVGPQAGKGGGYIVAEGTPEEVMDNPKSVTGEYLSGKKVVEHTIAKRKYGKNISLEITNARSNNLKNVNLKIPLGKFIAVSGVSGGGKSTLIMDTLCRALQRKLTSTTAKPGLHDDIINYDYVDKLIKIDQAPIGRTPRSNPATYTGVFSLIRDLFASLPESRMKGYKAGRFSFNVKGGRCENCRGDGVIKVEMHFLPDVYVDCSVCKGTGYNNETLEVKYKNKNISEILKMEISEALKLFYDIPPIREKLKTLQDVGLDYIELGQIATTLSGGEAQRIKLAKELSKKSPGENLYVLDEPTTGLHSHDINNLLHILQKLVDRGNTVLVIEHNIDVIRSADYVIDIGPKGGDKGGFIVAEGTPQEVADNPNSVTGAYIKDKILASAKK